MTSTQSIFRKEISHSHDAPRIAGIDWLRLVAICMVLLLHVQPISPCKNGNAPFLFFYPIAAFYDFVGCLGVPLFFLVSLFLLEKKLQQEQNYLGARLKRLIALFLFWTAIQFFIWGITFVTGMEGSQSLAASSLIATVLVGGPPLPTVGESVIYFISDLVLLTVVHYFIRGYLRSKSTKIFAISLCLIFFYVAPICRNLFLPAEHDGFLASVLNLEYCSPLNFLVFIPIAIWLNKSYLERSQETPTWSSYSRLSVLLGLYLLAVGAEISIRLLTEMPFRVYARPSLPLGAWVLMEIALRIRNAPLWVLKLSRVTLGVFAIHKYWIIVARKSIPDLPILAGPILENCRIDASDPIRLFLVAGLTYASARALARNSTFKPFVSS